MDLSDELARVSRLARRDDDVHEATELLHPLAKRLRHVLALLSSAADKLSEHKRTHANQLLRGAFRTFAYLVDRQKSTPLASRVVHADRLAFDVAELHGETNPSGEIVGGLDAVLATLGEHTEVNEWRRAFEQEKRDHVELLHESIRDAKRELLEDPSMARETIVLLKHARAYGHWHPLADKLWSVVEPLVAATNDGLLDLPAWFIPESDIAFRSRMLDRGGFATVHFAMWNGCSVVVKAVQDINVQQTKQLKRFVNEVEIGYGLSHPHVIKMYGACHTRCPPLIVCEFAKQGNLSDYLHRHEHKAPKWRLLYEAALGLQFLHSKEIVHGDVKLNNFFVMADGTVKVGDFGLSRREASAFSEWASDEGGVGAIRWRAPECFRTMPTFESDVYSFGMCVYEAVAGTIPYEDVADGAVEDLICAGKLPHRPECMTNEVWELIKQMTHVNPDTRSSLRSVVGILKELSNREEPIGVSSVAANAQLVGELSASLDVLSSKPLGSTDKVEMESVDEVVQGLRRVHNPSVQGRALKWIWRMSILTENYATAQTYAKLSELGGVSAMILILTNSESSFAHKMYVLDVLIRINNQVLKGAISAVLDDAMVPLRPPNAYEMSCLYRGMGCATSIEEQLQALEVLSVLFTNDMVDGDINHIVLELLRLIKTGIPRIAAAVAYTISCLVSGSKTNKSPLLVDAVGPIVNLLEFPEDHCKLCSSIAVAQLASNDLGLGDAIVKAGAIEHLVKIMGSECTTTNRWAACALNRLVSNSPQYAEAAADLGAIEALVGLIKTQSNVVKYYSAHGLSILAQGSAKNSKAIAHAGAVELLLELVCTGSNECQKRSAYALGILSSASYKIRDKIVAAGAVHSLVNLLNSDSSDCQECGAFALSNLVSESQETVSQIRSTGAVVILVKLLSSSSDTCKHQAAATLRAFTVAFTDIKTDVVTAGAIGPLVQLLRMECSDCKQQGARTLATLAENSLENAWAIHEADAVPACAKMMKIGPIDCKRWGAHALGKIAAHVTLWGKWDDVSQPLKDLLKSDLLDHKEAAGCAVANLTRTISWRCKTDSQCELEMVKPLVELIKAGSIGCKQYYVRALGDLAWANSNNAKMARSAGAVDPLKDLFQTGSSMLKQEVVRTLGNLACWGEVKHPPTVRILVDQLKSRDDDYVKQSAHALEVLVAYFPTTKPLLVEYGVIDTLVVNLKRSWGDIGSSAAGALGALAKNSPEISVAIADSGAIGPLINLVKSAGSGKNNGEHALLCLAWDSPATKIAIAKAGAIDPILSLIRGSRENRCLALQFLISLSSEPATVRQIVDAGAVPILKNLRKCRKCNSCNRVDTSVKTILKNLRYERIRGLFKWQTPGS